MSADPSNTFYVTTPIYYVNDKPHLGHVYTTMVADVVARYHRLRGDDTFFLTGVDEHAAKVSDKAAEHGKTPQEWADLNAEQFRSTFEKLEMTNDDFVRTSSDHHKAKVTEYVKALIDSDDIYEGEYVGWYDAGQEEYVPENKAKDNDYKSEVNGKPLVKKSEKNYFFRLSKYVPALLQHFEANPEFVQPTARKNEIVNRIKEAKDVPISRTGSGGWGIPVPGDEEQTIYVWIDALFNYLTYVDTPDRRHYWQSGATHFIAKDILWFHASIWPALLMALQKCEGYDWVNLPKQVYSHSYWVSKARLDTGEEAVMKMGKSTGNFLDPETLNALVDEFGLDALRYFLSTQGPLGTTDSEFSEDKYIEVYNADLANTFGNSASRVSNMIGKYFDGVLQDAVAINGSDHNYHENIPKSDRTWWDLHRIAFKKTDLSEASRCALMPVTNVDAYIEDTRPFTLAKDPEKMPEVGTILYNCAEALRIASVLLWPFIPDACEKFWSRIGCDYAEQMAANGGQGKLDDWVKWGQLQPGTPIEKGDALFPRYQPPKK
ncbi:methionine--tRNA ligase [Algisphaera agarilytica]|uniref:Methionine--tRNA ligase n=1 Tax=Algisphaera agarilytica TaxID=1385975 RepID=A0A7X0H540_9BACT|nr:methionine--tRNA ligase [Algisphaera agarilytica]MBB6429395.1 methionyl-tRNA synthetase [Algisphaera agarilytica]